MARGVILSSEIHAGFMHAEEGVVIVLIPGYDDSIEGIKMELTAEAAEKLGNLLIQAAEKARPSEEEDNGMMTWPTQLKGGEA